MSTRQKIMLLLATVALLGAPMARNEADQSAINQEIKNEDDLRITFHNASDKGTVLKPFSAPAKAKSQVTMASNLAAVKVPMSIGPKIPAAFVPPAPRSINGATSGAIGGAVFGALVGAAMGFLIGLIVPLAAFPGLWKLMAILGALVVGPMGGALVGAAAGAGIGAAVVGASQ